MGITAWVRRDLPEQVPVAVEATPTPNAENAQVAAVAKATPATASQEAEISSLPPPVVEPGHAASNNRVAQLDWPSLQQAVQDCQACELHKTRLNPVFGIGDPRARWMIVGEAPGVEEDKRGQPFVGKAGKLLDAMLQAVGLNRQTVFIANILKCRPPNNRDPQAHEIDACSTFLQRQIELIQPELILAVGRYAAQTLLQSNEPIGKLRGQVSKHLASGIPVVATYHPAYLLRQPGEKRKSWEDLKLAMTVSNPSNK
ncbi:MAG: uracil-DNA glycosylase [Gammaproteobacteria bacterium]|nr:uracil-DNA glycosylase [Gammaproteobacteria bacterium]